MKADRDSFRKLGLTLEEKAFYDILIALRDVYNFEYGTDRHEIGIMLNGKCKTSAKRMKEIIDTKSSLTNYVILQSKIIFGSMASNDFSLL